jgi:hypothetical protein
MNNDWKPTEQNIGQPVLDTYPASIQNNTYIPPQGTLKIGPTGYKLDPKKLAKAPQYITPYLFLGAFYYNEDYEYFDVIKPYLDIPEQPKTLDEIQQEFDEKIDALIEKTKRNFYASKLTAERNYEYKFDRISDNFEYAKEHGEFPPYAKLTYGTGLSTNPYAETSFVIKQGNKHEGYYTIGNRRYFRYYMPEKPNRLVRFFMKTCLGFFWVDDAL